MKLSDDGWLIGDPHLGRAFAGTPLHRRGERELSQLQQLKHELTLGVGINVMVGDLFDKPLVDLKVVHQVADLYEEAALSRPETLFVALAGNHDLFRQVRDPKTGEKLKGSFHAFARMVGHLPNVKVLFEPEIIGDYAFFPWQWEVSALAQVEKFSDLPDHAIGHWDLVDFGGSVEHMVPRAELRERGVKDIWSGHIHNRGVYDTVHCTGSLQPYAHDQDPDGKFYCTLTMDEYECMDSDQLKDMNVRLVLKPGEVLPDLDCLSLVSMREGEVEAIQLDEVGLGDFDVKIALEQRFEELQVPLKVRTYVREKIGAIA